MPRINQDISPIIAGVDALARANGFEPRFKNRFDDGRVLNSWVRMVLWGEHTLSVVNDTRYKPRLSIGVALSCFVRLPTGRIVLFDHGKLRSMVRKVGDAYIPGTDVDAITRVRDEIVADLNASGLEWLNRNYGDAQATLGRLDSQERRGVVLFADEREQIISSLASLT